MVTLAYQAKTTKEFAWRARFADRGNECGIVTTLRYSFSALTYAKTQQAQ
jgi:hypothetical protein